MTKYKTTIEVIGGQEELNEFIQLLVKIQILGGEGANRTIPVAVDGDGSGQLTFKVQDISPEPVAKMVGSVLNNGLLNMDKTSFMQQIDEGTLETHYIGE